MNEIHTCKRKDVQRHRQQKNNKLAREHGIDKRKRLEKLQRIMVGEALNRAMSHDQHLGELVVESGQTRAVHWIDHRNLPCTVERVDSLRIQKDELRKYQYHEAAAPAKELLLYVRPEIAKQQWERNEIQTENTILNYEAVNRW